MKLKKWTVKQVLFEREMNNPKCSIYFNGFKLPEDKDFLLAVLEELYGKYRNENRDTVLRILNEYLEHGVRRVEIILHGFHDHRALPNTIGLETLSKEYYPESNELVFIKAHMSTAYFISNRKPLRGTNLLKGYHIHKHCLVNPLTGR